MLSDFTKGPGSYVADVSTDILGVLGVSALFLALGVSKGRDELLSIIFAVYPAALITEYFPYYSLFASEGSAGATGRLIVFLTALLLSFFIARSYFDSTYEQRALWRFVEGVALSVAAVGLILSILYHIVDIETLHNFTPVLDVLVLSDTAFFLWLLAPLLSIPLFVRP